MTVSTSTAERAGLDVVHERLGNFHRRLITGGAPKALRLDLSSSRLSGIAANRQHPRRNDQSKRSHR